MKIGLIDVDGHNYPNFALMKISSFHKKENDTVEWVNHIEKYDKVYMSKVFTTTPDIRTVIQADIIERGGTGYDIKKVLPEKIDNCNPDYSIYPVSEWYDGKTAYGFLTRGCIRNCRWCIVSQKEGTIRPYGDIEEILHGMNKAILMDNNVLACEHGLLQLEKIVDLKCRVDFNQGLDARLVTAEIAGLLSKVRFIKNTIRFACDSDESFESVEIAKDLLQTADFKGIISIYVLLTEDIRECLSRIMNLDCLDWKEGRRTYKISLFAQPYIDFTCKRKVPQWKSDMARWCNMKSLFYSHNFGNYQPRKGFYCREYF